MTSTPRVLITRPQREAQAWAQQLAQHGVSCDVLPLIDIAPAANPQALHTAWQHLGACHAVMFVSANAAEFFMAAATDAGAAAGSMADMRSRRLWVTGPGTRAALIARGIPSGQIDSPPADAAQFDSETLWRLVRQQIQPGARVLIVRGADASGEPAGRDWLAQQLRAAGAAVDTLVAYRRMLPAWSEAQRAIARAAAHAQTTAADPPFLWLFSSSEAVSNLRALMPDAHWSGATAMATHPRIAQAARDAGFGRVVITRPAVDDVVASIKSLHGHD